MNVTQIRQYVRSSYCSMGQDFKPLVSYYKNAVKNPTLAIVVKNDEINNIIEEFRCHGGLGYYEQKNAKNGFKKMYNIKEVQTERESFWNKFSELYPKSGLIRAILCRSSRVNPKYVRPKAGSNLKEILITEYKKFTQKNLEPKNII